MDRKQVLQVLGPQWRGGYWAKSSGELLWTHHFNVWSVGSKLAEYAPSLDDGEKRLLEFALLTHDIGKRRPKCQERLHQGMAPGNHKLLVEELNRYFLEELGGEFGLSSTDITSIWDIARTHHSVSDEDIRIQSFERATILGRLLIAADWIASMEQPAFETLARLQTFYQGRLALTYFAVSRFASPTTYLIVKLALEHYRKTGWEPLVVFPQGAVFVGPSGSCCPSRKELAHDCEQEIIKQSLALQAPLPTGYTGDFLTLLSKQYPALFLKGQEIRIVEELGSINRGLVFQKLARDILAARSLINEEAKKACPVLALVDSANSTSAHPNAKKRYSEVYGRRAPEKVNRDMLDPLFEESIVAQVIPARLSLPVDSGAILRELKPRELFGILEAIASSTAATVEESPLQQYLHTCLLAEEDLDFAGLARQTFERYKQYKRTSDADKGLCERCACPVATKMQPGLNFATSPQAFSQIKAKYQYRAICALCGYDNLVVRHDVRSGKSFVYARLESKLPDLLTHMPGLNALIARVASGLRRPRQLARLAEVPELAGLPFPSHLRIPLSDDKQSTSDTPAIALNEGGVLIRLAEIPTARGPKDLRCEFEPLYHVLHYLGYQVSVGSEEQNGLFGEPVLTTEVGYLRSLAVILLASVLDKSVNRYIFASEMLDRSPSVALTAAAGDGRDKFGLKREFLRTFLGYLVKADVLITTPKGQTHMKHLLEDAAFLAPSWVEVKEEKAEETTEQEEDPEEDSKEEKRKRGGMWTFCERKGKRDEWLTKHAATKPISQALDELMLGRGVPFALNKFMQHLNVKVKKEQCEELTAFLSGVRDILNRAERIRTSNITDFLRYKNGLLSAVFMLTRYPDLKPVVTSKEN